MSVETYVQELPKPKCACSFNGTYLEDVVAGFRTSFVTGRDSYSGELHELSNVFITGKKFDYMSEKSRDITISYYLHADTEENFHKRYNALRDFLLKNREAQLIFNDENDVYYVGTVVDVSSNYFANYRNASGEIKIHCADPCKYSVQEYIAYPDPQVDEGQTFVVDYDGTWKSRPTFEVNFFASDDVDNDDGDCGYVGLVNQNGSILQFGNPNETDDNTYTESTVTTKTVSETWINHRYNSFTKDYKWVVNPEDAIFRGNDKIKSGSCGIIQNGRNLCWGVSSLSEAEHNYGSGEKLWHGPVINQLIKKKTDQSLNPTGAKNWNCEYTQIFTCPTNKKKRKKCRGTFSIYIIGDGAQIIAGVTLSKDKDSTTGVVKLIVNNSIVKEFKADFSHGSKKFGYGKKPNRTTTIKKKNGKITFNVAGTKKSFTNNSLINVNAKKVQFLFQAYGDKVVPEHNLLYNFKFTCDSVTKSVTSLTERAADNTFSTNDRLTIDCSTASVYKGIQTPIQSFSNSSSTIYEVGDRVVYNNAVYECIIRTTGGTFYPNRWQFQSDDIFEESIGNREDDLGALGNDWEDFYLEPGINQINVAYSDWVQEGKEPTFAMRYRKVYL